MLFRIIFLNLLFLTFLSNCGYKPLFNADQLNNFKFRNIQVEGDKRIVQILINKLGTTEDKNGDFKISIDGKKKVYVSNKDTTGKILEYGVNLVFEIEVENIVNGEKLYLKKISKDESFKNSNNYSDTISSEKKVIDNISELISTQIKRELSVILRNDI